ncbi:MAG: aminotransferase class III-fold pyridoxal phosphate-dependent enzyme, partial [Rhodobacteraceae bacterium]|nr:aminotransferase class III-fold pyridoxal phosphate-dependent enzyme [Paracoccaceae bacterium]
MDAALTNDPAHEAWAQDHRHFFHPWTHFDSFRTDGSLVMEKADGLYISDAHGNRYLDGVGGLWCMNVGYGRDEIVDAIADQARKLAYANPFVDITNEPAAELAAKLAELAPGDLNRVMFSCGGSTANDSAYRLIQYYFGCKGEKQRRHVLTRRGSYHGSTYIAQSLTGKPADRQPEFAYETEKIHHTAEPNAYRPPEGVADEDFTDFLIDDFAAKIEEIGPENIMAHFAEPILGAGGVVVPPMRYIRETREMCRKHGIIYVADEVVTGFGRLGAWFASKDVMGIQPDIIVCAKGLTSGYQPLGATIVSDAIYDVVAEAGHPERLFTNGFTYSGHPVACAAALKNIEIMERERLPERVREDVGP